jgi:phage portal protein BeeE
VLHFQGLTNNGVVGIAKIQALREKLGIQQSMDKFSGSFYANGTTTRGILKVPLLLEKMQRIKLGKNGKTSIAVW